MESYTTSDIPESGACPECGTKHGNWITYTQPEKGEVGILCPICYTHFVDKELSFEEPEFDEF